MRTGPDRALCSHLDRLESYPPTATLTVEQVRKARAKWLTEMQKWLDHYRSAALMLNLTKSEVNDAT